MSVIGVVNFLIIIFMYFFIMNINNVSTNSYVDEFMNNNINNNSSSSNNNNINLFLRNIRKIRDLSDSERKEINEDFSTSFRHQHHHRQQYQQQQHNQQKNSHSRKRQKHGLHKIKKKHQNQQYIIENVDQSDDEGSSSSPYEFYSNQNKKIQRQKQNNNKNALRLLSGKQNTDEGGLWPPVTNVALKSSITVNATCGQHGREEYCKILDAHPQRSKKPQCGICDASSLDTDRRHSILNSLDKTNNWWQSPILTMGSQYEYVTITLDLKNIYQIIFIALKSAVSPRPASWILERSFDGHNFYPWQYFGVSDSDCRKRYNLPGSQATHIFQSDSEIICSVQFSKVVPLENGEIQVLLFKNRPGAKNASIELVNFTLARYIRIRLQGMHTTVDAIDRTVDWLVDAQALQKRSFYSIRFLKIGGRLNCNGHASKIRHLNVTADDIEDSEECNCFHNTCGSYCERCCPLFNQQPYRVSSTAEPNHCEKCECYGHATECYYNPEVDEKGLSMNTQGVRSGGGVCVNCTHMTAGINCEQCIDGYYRPYGVLPDARNPCIPCDCDPIGTDGTCNPYGGECKCHEGFTGLKCSNCASGYKGENCNKCACDVRGTMPGGECESHCQCKLHAEGQFCSRCLPGYFALTAKNPEGCIQCYCSGVSNACKRKKIQIYQYETMDGWKITDISKSLFEYPTRDNNTGVLIFGLYELADIESVYWLAPRGYTGNLLESYGSKFTFKIDWVIVRGDTSGKPTIGPSIILIGRNGMKIAFGDNTYKNSNATINVQLTEDGWYHVPRTVKDIVTRLRRTEYRGDPVTRIQFMSVLSDVESVLLRGTYHTDQIETILNRATLNSVENDVSDADDDLSLVELCHCPIGYAGDSCESCDFGYARIYENSTAHERLGKCIPCGCNGHAESCDLVTGKCTECLHNTFGDRCERCAIGYYGNAMYGTVNDCKRCACPLLDEENNFSPNCQLKELTLTNELGWISNRTKYDKDYNVNDENDDDNNSANNGIDYVCTQCPIGYTGDLCEICDDGYYGSPTIIGSKCLPCPCNGGPCDPFNGHCITCLGNTEGWRCERCKLGYWGNPLTGCEPCMCHDSGSISQICDPITGLCTCKQHFTGETCNECQIGYGNVTLDCPACSCNLNGSIDDECNRVTGQCKCKDGVENLKCDTCMENYFGLSIMGCDDCRCNPYGAVNRGCNRLNGRCHCRANITGRTCDRCKQGHWNLESGLGCHSCHCDTIGSQNTSCHIKTGQCNCKSGVGGLKCDQCLDGYYGFSSDGCKKCDHCSNSAFICDSNTGRCVCPPLSQGHYCQQCFPNAWGFEHRKGCKLCECNHSGAIGQNCDLSTGQCVCREGYMGRNCDNCMPGYYGYPNCQRCNCNHHGTLLTDDDLGICDIYGQCPCKSLVTGKKCDQCRQATFGLSIDNAEGCTRCFCFGRSQACQQSDLTWSQIRSYGSRNLSVEYIPAEYDYVVVVQMEGSRRYQEDAEIQYINGLTLIPSSTGNISIGSSAIFTKPLYFQLPPQFLDDQITSFGGYLRYSISTEGCNVQLKNIHEYPLIQIHSHNDFVIDYFGPEILNTESNTTYSVKMHEKHWRYHKNNRNITRAIMMTALENIRHIFLRGTFCADFEQVVISNVTLDSGIYLSGAVNNVAIGVEQCDCPSMYNGTSCQNPGRGYYRRRVFNENREPILEDLVGHVIPCECNERSNECDRETGHCQNCSENTGGINCEMCAEGYYGEPDFIGCQACPCPETNRNYARGCTVNKKQVSCICKNGYTGPLCDKCMMGFYGNPDVIDGECKKCECNPDGIVSDECDEITGQCNCKLGVTGRQCDKCEETRHILQDKQCKICDNCTLTLLDSIEEMQRLLNDGANHIDPNGIPAPWPRLLTFENVTVELDLFLKDYLDGKKGIEGFDDEIIEKLNSKASNINKRLQKLLSKTNERQKISNDVKVEAHQLLSDIIDIRKIIENTINTLNEYGTHDHHINLPIALTEAKSLLNDIKSKHFDSTEDQQETVTSICDKNSLEKWLKESDILSKQAQDIGQIKLDLSDLFIRLEDTAHNTFETNEQLKNAKNLHLENTENYKKLQEKLEKIKNLKNDLNSLYNTSIIPKTDLLIKLNEDHDKKIQQDLDDIMQLRDIVNEANADCAEGLKDIRNNYLPEAQDHATDLIERAKNYSKLFKNTRDGAKIALLASTAYKNISDAIDAARMAANETIIAVDNSENELYPVNGKSVIDKGIDSLKKSHNIQEDAVKVLLKLEDLEDNLKDHENSVDSVKDSIWQSGLKNNNISSMLNTLENNAMKDSLADSQKVSLKVSDDMKKVLQESGDISNDIDNLKTKLTSLEPDWDTKLGRAEENVSESLSNIREAKNKLTNMEALAEKNGETFKKWNDTMGSRLQEIKDKIAKARHASEGIRVSMQSNNGIKCKRSYISPVFGLTTSTTIKMSIALSTIDENSPLLFIQGDDRKFIAIEMIQRKIRFLWNLGGDTGIIDHPIELQMRDPKYDDAWYYIEANRTMNIGSLTVRQVSNNGTTILYKTGASSPEYTRFIITPNNRIWIGGVPSDIHPNELISENGLGVVLHQIFIDEKPIGLWHFVHSEGDCGGAMLGAHEPSPTLNSRYFNGDGYAIVSKTKQKPPKKQFFSIQITFKTLDENALLFLAVDEINNRSISLTLHEGKIVFRIDYGGESKLEINTTNRYNMGTWVNVEAARQYTPKRSTENGSLKVNNEEPKTGSPTIPITANLLPDLSKAVYYLGGVPPGFKSGTTKAPGADHAYLGCMKDIQINEETYDPMESASYFGVEPTCKESITNAGFYGNGYVELPSHSMLKNSNFGFVFRTLQPKCLLLLSVYPPNISDDYDSSDVRGNYSVSLIDGKMYVWLDAGRGRIELQSNTTESLNDGAYHVLSVTKSGRKVELRIDDELQSSTRFPYQPFAINMPKDTGGFFVGGAPDHPDYDNLAPTFNEFEGSIKDIVFNNRTIYFNEAINFTNVHMGRNGPKMGNDDGLSNGLMKTEAIGKSFTAVPEGCHRVGVYSYEPNAFKFGDGPKSYSVINIQTRNMWKKNFTIQFDFRTFYPDGLLFLAPGTKEKQKHFVGLFLKDGLINLIVRGRKKQEVSLPLKLNDGHWHHIGLNNVNRKLQISIVSTTINGTIKIPKRLNVATIMYIGGISDDNLSMPIELLSKSEEFKGCIRRFKVNGTPQDLARPGRHNNVGQCFPKVEKGSYFPGDAYAIYKRSFHVGKYLELEFEFRTSELNGVLLSVSEPNGFPALSIEMHNGKIVMSCDIGDGNPFRVETDLPSKFALCDNRWHNVSALYDSEQIALKIDSQPSLITLAQHSTSGKVYTKTPLYIGGLPDTAPSGTLLSRENFKGCIRNVLIRNELKDWTDMDDLHNVLLSECLAIN